MLNIFKSIVKLVSYLLAVLCRGFHTCPVNIGQYLLISCSRYYIKNKIYELLSVQNHDLYVLFELFAAKDPAILPIYNN